MHQLKYSQKLPINLDEAWEFFSTPSNLSKITPASLNFVITSQALEGKMYPGQIISYTVEPFLGIPLEWITEITHVQPKNYFVDEQRKGPYKMWHHEHHFKETSEGHVEITDLVSYVLPFGPLGEIAQKLFVKKQLEEIFTYRTKVLETYFEH